jgi:hypothetical protein
MALAMHARANAATKRFIAISLLPEGKRNDTADGSE